MTPTPSPDPGRCPECGCGWWEPHRTGCSEPRFLTPDPAAAGEGTERPDTAALLTIGDWLLRTLPGHRGAEQTAATLAYTARWIDAQPPVPPTPTPCPYIVTGDEGTSHCSLAERGSSDLDALVAMPEWQAWVAAEDAMGKACRREKRRG